MERLCSERRLDLTRSDFVLQCSFDYIFSFSIADFLSFGNTLNKSSDLGQKSEG